MFARLGQPCGMFFVNTKYILYIYNTALKYIFVLIKKYIVTVNVNIFINQVHISI